MTKTINVLKKIAVKVPEFLFCVIFVAVYNALFLKENSIAGVELLIGILMFPHCDLGFHVKQATIAIPVLFIGMALAARIALINPFLGIIINFGAIMLMLIVSTNDITTPNYIPFIIGYIFCQGYDVVSIAFGKRMLSVILGAIIIALLYYKGHKDNTYDMKIQDIFKNLNIRKENMQWYIKLAVTLTITMFLGHIFGYTRIMWVNLAVLSVLHPQQQNHEQRKKQRIPATLIATIAFFILFKYVIPLEYRNGVAMFVGFTSMFMTSYFHKTIFNSFNAMVSSLAAFSVTTAVLLRIISNIIGVLVASASHFIFERIYSTHTPSIEIEGA